jgi:hypothetical protein
MKNKIWIVSIGLLIGCLTANAQTCKVKIAVVYTNGKDMQIGLTAEQQKFWDRDGAKHFPGFCLDPKEPNYVILWSEGLSGSELTKSSIDQFNRGRATGQNTSTGSTTPINSPNWASGRALIRPTQQVREKADYWVMDMSTTPPSAVRQGTGYQDVPMGRANQPGQAMKTSDLASTIADPAAAMENALRWIKKTKKF